jgi:tRNA G37 N-methylase TrmD
MKKLSIALFSLAFTGISYGECLVTGVGTAPNGGNDIVCNTDAPNPETTAINDGSAIPTTVAGDRVEMLAGAEMLVNGEDAMDTDEGDDLVTLTDAKIVTSNTAIEVRGGEDEIIVTDSRLYAGDSAISGGYDDDVMTVMGSEMVSGDTVLGGGNSNDQMTVIDSALISIDDVVLNGGNGNDEFMVTDSILRAPLVIRSN